jgi:hypothetical protein
MATNLTIVDVFEEVLQIPFEPAYSVDLAADVFLVRKLAHRLEDYYQSFEIPLKADNELRPYLYQGYIDGSIFWDSFVRFEGSTYTVSSSAPSMEAMIKPYLLYSHSVCIPDPLPGLLDYFRRNTGSASSLETARLPGVINLLQQYARTSKLIRHRILIPFSFEDTFGRVSSNHFWPTAAERAEIKRSLLNNNDHASGDSAGDLKILMAEKIKEQLWITHRSGGRLDLYFPTSHYVPLLRSLLRSAQQPYASADIRLPFHAGFLGGVSNLD